MTQFFVSWLISFFFLILTDALSLRTPTRIVSPQKTNLLNYVDGTVEDIYVCPKSLSPLKHVYRCFGLFEEEYLVSEQDNDLKYCVLPNKYIDLTIKTEVERPVWALSVRERVGQNLFQTKLLPAIYERGYRQNFQVSLLLIIMLNSFSSTVGTDYSVSLSLLIHSIFNDKMLTLSYSTLSLLSHISFLSLLQTHLPRNQPQSLHDHVLDIVDYWIPWH